MRIGAVILAAGAGTRFGGPKQLAALGGESMVRRAVRTAHEAGCSPVVVVVGCQSRAVISQLGDLDVTIAENENWAAGLGTSIRSGVAVISNSEPACDGAVLLTCDQPMVTAETIHALSAALTQNGGSIAACAYADTVGVPALFKRDRFRELSSLPDAAGAKHLLQNPTGEVVTVNFSEGEYDIDYREDLERFRSVTHLT